MCRYTRWGGVLLAALGLLATEREAPAFVRRTTSAGKPVYWASSCAWVFPDTQVPSELTLPLLETTLGKALANWQSVTQTGPDACSYLKLAVDPAAKGEATYDGKNIVKFRTDAWCRPADSASPQICFSPSIASITTTIYNPDTGEILDNDIELNAVNFSFLIEPTTTAPRDNTIGIDLEGTLTHELGHFQGLDHTCWDHVAATPPLDNTGAPVPDCNTFEGVDDASVQAIESTTMFPFPPPGSITERAPKADDIAGICSIYSRDASAAPACVRPSAPPGTSSPAPSEFACALSHAKSPSSPAGWAAALGMLSTLFARRRARREHR